MRFEIRNIGEDGVAIDAALDSAWLSSRCPELEGELGTGGLRLKAQLTPTGEDFLLRGRLKGNLRMTCVRCLEPTDVPIDSEVSVLYVEGAAPAPARNEDGTPAEVVVADDEDAGDDVAYFQDGVIDLADEVREEIFLALPMNPRHEPECAGICPQCGNDRATQPCDCAEKQRAAQSPFAALAKLKKS